MLFSWMWIILRISGNSQVISAILGWDRLIPNDAYFQNHSSLKVEPVKTGKKSLNFCHIPSLPFSTCLMVATESKFVFGQVLPTNIYKHLSCFASDLYKLTFRKKKWRAFLKVIATSKCGRTDMQNIKLMIHWPKNLNNFGLVTIK